MAKTVRDFMTTRVATVGPDTRLDSIVRAFSRHPFHHLPVVDGAGAVVGIVSDRDLMRACTGGKFDEDKPASSIMTTLLACIEPDATVQDAAKRLMKLGVNSLLILESGKKLRGIITSRDLVKALATSE
jgi:acetoin utilization protein AcuB